MTALIRERLGETVADEPKQVVEAPSAEGIAPTVPVVEEKPLADEFGLNFEVERPLGRGQIVVQRRASQGQIRLF